MKKKLEKALKEFRETGIDYEKTIIIQRFINFVVQRERLNEETTKHIDHNLSIGLTPKDWYDENKK